ncbi:MAG: OsmC family protein [Candidatus Omnitrophica bacterium]|jgi:uncharacterized OsmC-like protein|nr:OsmC family protein [Candidatus Omnitrophota bacterium]
METRAEVKFIQEDKFQIKTYPSETTLFIDKMKEAYLPQGPNSLELFLSALGGCIGVYAKMYLLRHQIAFKELNIKVSAELSKESPIQLVNLRANVYTDAQLGEKKDIFLRFIKNCPVHNTILNTQEIEISLSR